VRAVHVFSISGKRRLQDLFFMAQFQQEIHRECNEEGQSDIIETSDQPAEGDEQYAGIHRVSNPSVRPAFGQACVVRRLRNNAQLAQACYGKRPGSERCTRDEKRCRQDGSREYRACCHQCHKGRHLDADQAKGCARHFHFRSRCGASARRYALWGSQYSRLSHVTPQIGRSRRSPTIPLGIPPVNLPVPTSGIGGVLKPN